MPTIISFSINKYMLVSQMNSYSIPVMVSQLNSGLLKQWQDLIYIISNTCQ